MWAFIFVTLGFCCGALAGDNIVCLLQAEKECHAHSIFPEKFPSDEEELRNYCLNLNPVKECIANTLRNCSSENTDDFDNELFRKDFDDNERRRQGDSRRVTDMRRMVDVAAEICDETSKLHRNFVPYMSCIQTAIEIDFEDQACRDYTNNAIELLRSRIENKARLELGNLDEYQKVRLELYGCLRVLFGMNCFIIQFVKSCDSGVKQPILEMLEKGGSLYYQCPAARRIDVIELLESLELVMRQEVYVKDLVTVKSLF